MQPLPPDAYRDIVRRALAEDLGNGRCHDRGHGAADAARPRRVPRRRRPACWPGLDVAARGLPAARTVGGRDRSPGTTATAATPGDDDRGSRRPRADAADRRAHGAELPAAAVRHRHAHPRSSSMRPRAASPSSTRARRRRRCARWRSTPSRPAAATNHRVGLFDAILIKDNHVRLAGGVAAAVARGRARHRPDLRLEVEAQTLDEVDEALDAGADIVLARQHVDRRHSRGGARRARGRAKVEISGGVTLDRIAGAGGDRRRLRVGRRADALGACGGHQLRDRAALTDADVRLARAASPRSSRTRSTRARPRLAPLGRPAAVLRDHRLDQRRRRRARRRRPTARAPSSSPTRRPPDAAGAAQLVLAAWRGLYVSVVLAPGRRGIAPRRATALLTLRRASRWRSGRACRPGFAPTSSGRTICWSDDASSPASSPKASRGRARPASSAVVLGYGVNVGAAAYPPELDDRVTSLEIGARPRGRSRGALRRDACGAGATLRRPARRSIRCYSRRVARAARRAAAARASSWDTPAGMQAGITDGIDDTGALLVRIGERASNGSWRARCSWGSETDAASHRRRQHQHRRSACSTAGRWSTAGACRRCASAPPTSSACWSRGCSRTAASTRSEHRRRSCIGSVVPPLTGTMAAMVQRYFSATPLVVDPAHNTGMPILLREPGGSRRRPHRQRDRRLRAVRRARGRPLIVCDFGTATTLDAVSARASTWAARSAPASRSPPTRCSSARRGCRASTSGSRPRVIGRTTVGAMESGLFYGYVGMVEGLVRRMTRRARAATRSASRPAAWPP